jgi:hypothetical protein
MGRLREACFSLLGDMRMQLGFARYIGERQQNATLQLSA